ncbi:biopolymer transporter ExbB [Pelagivirga sediminicola]|uniref:Biopolymer transporter ExbB n=1 Tax=Pelagivirga sediminicola TaxID=2170575 RepID=A0A2T7G644_9RHOB|nr:biopolymer transporter ExbB [Pelagivirga sediminicola]PVA09888.1 biopolymer transporter ExbB [Pelagivirga sediminicola]
MDQPDREVEPHFSQPWRQIVMMVLVLGLSALGAFMALPRVLPVFEANPYLNGFIFFVFLIGVVACFWQVFQLIGSVRWIEGFARDAPGVEMTKPPLLLAPLAALLRQRGKKRMQISHSSARSIQDMIAQRIDEAREITRYIVNVLIFLGLLGTFYGLATTVPALVETIRGLAPQKGEGGVEVFTRLMTGLQSQLGGMGVAFASSLLGLAGSLIVGLLELFAGHGQNRFYRELEEWMSTITRVGFAGAEEGSPEQALLTGIVDQMSEQMESLQQMLTQSDISRAASDDQMARLSAAVEKLASPESDGTAEALARVAQGQESLIALLEAREAPGDGALDAESRMRLRSIDVQMLRILEEISAGRQESMTELRTDLAGLKAALHAVRAPRRSYRTTAAAPHAPEQEG